jgi:hypothetical protein
MGISNISDSINQDTLMLKAEPDNKEQSFKDKHMWNKKGNWFRCYRS